MDLLTVLFVVRTVMPVITAALLVSGALFAPDITTQLLSAVADEYAARFTGAVQQILDQIFDAAPSQPSTKPDAGS